MFSWPTEGRTDKVIHMCPLIKLFEILSSVQTEKQCEMSEANTKTSDTIN